MRRLMWFTIGFGTACCLCAYGILRQDLHLPSALFLFLLSAAGRVFSAEDNWLRRASAVLLGGSFGLFWFLGFHTWYLRSLDPMVDTGARMEMIAADYSQQLDYGSRVDGILIREEKAYQIRAYLNTDCTVEPGDRITGKFSLRYADQEVSTYFHSKGIFLFAYEQEDIQILKSKTIPFWCYPSVLRRQIQMLLEACFPEDVSPFAKALLLGDGTDLEYVWDTAFKISGIRHIIAVSGLHISILYGVICLVTFRRRFLTAAAAVPVLLLFAAVTGFTPSVLRACIMVWLMLLAQLLDREYDPPTALAFAVLVMLAVNPMAAASVSLQMSAACVAGILLFNQPIQSWLKHNIPRKVIPKKLYALVCSSVSVTLSASSLVTPLIALYFGTVSLVSVLTNVLTLWVVNLIFHGLILTCLLWWSFPWAARILAALLAWPIRYVLLTAKGLSAVPLAAVYTKSVYIVCWLVFVYILLALLLLHRKKQPGLLLCCGTLGLCCALLASWTEPMLDTVRITMLDVGQGQSILLQSENKTFLVDCGGDGDAETADVIAETLLSQGIRRLDGIVLTHYDRDHSGALHNLLTRIDTGLLILPDTRNDFLLPETEAKILWVWEDLELTFGNSHMVIYGPVYSGADNENSLCILFDTENCDILITGDRTGFGERMLMRRRKLPDVDILVAGHHGAATSTTGELLHTVTPETVLISVKEGNYYGHPAPVLLQRLEDYGCTVYRTDRHGTILIRR